MNVAAHALHRRTSSAQRSRQQKQHQSLMDKIRQRGAGKSDDRPAWKPQRETIDVPHADHGDDGMSL